MIYILRGKSSSWLSTLQREWGCLTGDKAGCVGDGKWSFLCSLFLICHIIARVSLRFPVSLSVLWKDKLSPSQHLRRAVMIKVPFPPAKDSRLLHLLTAECPSGHPQGKIYRRVPTPLAELVLTVRCCVLPTLTWRCGYITVRWAYSHTAQICRAFKGSCACIPCCLLSNTKHWEYCPGQTKNTCKVCWTLHLDLWLICVFLLLVLKASEAIILMILKPFT